MSTFFNPVPFLVLRLSTGIVSTGVIFFWPKNQSTKRRQRRATHRHNLRVTRKSLPAPKLRQVLLKRHPAGQDAGGSARPSSRARIRPFGMIRTALGRALATACASTSSGPGARPTLGYPTGPGDRPVRSGRPNPHRRESQPPSGGGEWQSACPLMDGCRGGASFRWQGWSSALCCLGWSPRSLAYLWTGPGGLALWSAYLPRAKAMPLCLAGSGQHVRINSV